MLLGAVLMALAAFRLDLCASRAGLSAGSSHALVVNAIVAMEVAYLFATRQTRQSGFSLEGFRGTPAVWIGIALVTVAQLAFTYLPPMQAAFGTGALGLTEILLCLGVAALLFVAVEVEKVLRRR